MSSLQEVRTQHLWRPQHVDSAQRSGSREVGGHTLGVVCGRRRGRPEASSSFPSKTRALHFRAEEKGTSSIAGCFSPGSASAIASLVLLPVVALATKRLSRFRRSSWPIPRGRTSASFRRFVVSVPVLSRQNVSTLLSDSMALVCCTSALAGHPHCSERVGDHDRQQEPLRHQADNHHQPLDQLDERVAPGDRADGQHHHQERRHQERQPDHTVDLALQRRQDATLGAGTGGDLVGEAVPADLLRLEAGAR